MKQKIKNIELLRIIGCIAIIFVHLFANKYFHSFFEDVGLYNKMFVMTKNGYLAVELFFMLSGLFFVLTFDKTKTIWEFLKKKLIRLYPVLVFTMLLFFILSLMGDFEFTFYNNILTLLCLNGTGLVLRLGNCAQFWYVSSMLWVLLLYFYLLKYYDKKNVNLFAAISVFFAYTFLIHAKKGSIEGTVKKFEYIYTCGILIALGGIGIGYLIGDWYKNNLEKIKSYVPSLKMKLFYTVIEFMSLYFIINNLMLHKINYNNHMIFIASFAIIIVLFLAKKGFISKILENDIWTKPANYTYSLYMIHPIVYSILSISLWKNNSEFVYAHPILNIFITLIFVLIAGILTYHLVEIPSKNYLTNIRKRKDLQ